MIFLLRGVVVSEYSLPLLSNDEQAGNWRPEYSETSDIGLRGRSDIGLRGRSDIGLRGRSDIGLKGRSLPEPGLIGRVKKPENEDVGEIGLSGPTASDVTEMKGRKSGTLSRSLDVCFEWMTSSHICACVVWAKRTTWSPVSNPFNSGCNPTNNWNRSVLTSSVCCSCWDHCCRCSGSLGTSKRLANENLTPTSNPDSFNHAVTSSRSSDDDSQSTACTGSKMVCWGSACR